MSAVERRTSKGSQGDSLGRVCTRCATAIIVAGLMSTSGPAVAQDVPRPGPFDRYQVSVKNPAGQLVFDMRAAPRNRDIEGRFVSKGTMRFSPKLCEATYRLRFVITTIRGPVRKVPYPARMRRARFDGAARRCPFDGLPRRGLKKMDGQITIDGKPLMSFTALPSTRRGNPFARLKTTLRFQRPNTPAGLIRVRIRAQYPSHRSHTVAFVADTDVSVPPG